jgi:hypothetical protein
VIHHPHPLLQKKPISNRSRQRLRERKNQWIDKHLLHLPHLRIQHRKRAFSDRNEPQIFAKSLFGDIRSGGNQLTTPALSLRACRRAQLAMPPVWADARWHRNSPASPVCLSPPPTNHVAAPSWRHSPLTPPRAGGRFDRVVDPEAGFSSGPIRSSTAARIVSSNLRPAMPSRRSTR